MWAAADKLRGHMDASEYKHVVLGLVFLKYISDAFEERQTVLAKDKDSDSEDPDEYRMANVFWVPKVARWGYLQDNAKQVTIGKLVDDAMVAIEAKNTSLKGVLPKDYARPTLDKTRLGELIDLIGTIGLGDKDNRSKDVLGRVYEYFLGQFASREGKKGGEFYTPRCVVKLLVEMIEPFKGRVYDPCCGSAGMFVQSEEFILAHGGGLRDISIYGQESNPTTWRLAMMNLAIRQIEANLGGESSDTFRRDLHKDLKADFILANPPFNMKDWGAEHVRGDVRWFYGEPPSGSANYAWIQHMVHHLAPGGVAGFVMSNGPLTSNAGGEGDIRRKLVEADLVDCVVSLPNQLFYSTSVSAALWFLTRGKEIGRVSREGKTLFIDARAMGHLVDKTHRDLSSSEIARIADTYHDFRRLEQRKGTGVPGFSRVVTTDQIAAHRYALVPGRFVGFPENRFGKVDPAAVSKGMSIVQHRISESIERFNTSMKALEGLRNG